MGRGILGPHTKGFSGPRGAVGERQRAKCHQENGQGEPSRTGVWGVLQVQEYSREYSRYRECSRQC